MTMYTGVTFFLDAVYKSHLKSIFLVFDSCIIIRHYCAIHDHETTSKQNSKSTKQNSNWSHSLNSFLAT